MNLKTKEEIYCTNGGSYIRSAETEGHLKAMQQYADQQIESYKVKLKENVEARMDDLIDCGSRALLNNLEISELIDITTP